jgi:hypothetical protein
MHASAMPRKLIIAVATFCACLSSSASAQSLKWDSVALATYGIAAEWFDDAIPLTELINAAKV